MFRYAIKEFSNKNIHHAPTVSKVHSWVYVMQLVSSYKYCMIDGRASLRDTRNRETYIVGIGSLSTIMLHVKYGNMPSVGQCTI